MSAWRLAATALVVLMSLAALGACGGSDSVPAPDGSDRADVSEIETLTGEFAAAVEEKDAAAFCRTLDPRAVSRLGGAKRCRVVWGGGRNPFFAAGEPGLDVVRITKLKPPTAVAKLSGGGRLVYIREGGEWYVSIAPETSN